MAKSFGVTFAIGASVNPTVASAFATVEQKIRSSQAKMRELSDKAKVLAAADAARARVAETQKVFAASGGRDPMLREALEREIAAFHKAAAAAKKYGVSVADISSAHERTNRELAITGARLEAFQKANAYREKRQEAAGSIKAAAAPALAIAMPLRDAIKFESAMASAAKTIDGMRDESGRLTAQYYEMEAAIRQMGQTLPLTHDELARLFAAGGQQGMTAVADLREFTTMAAQMAVAFDMSNEEAADSIGGFRSALNMTMPQARELLGLMNYYANTSAASEKDIANVVRRIGSLGTVGGVAAKPMTALAATLVSMKVAPEVAATGIKNLILAMTSGSAATKPMKAAFASLGIDTVKLAKQMQVDGPAAILSVLEAVKKLPKAQQLSTMQQIFGKESLGAISPLLDQLDLVKQKLNISEDISKYGNSLQQEFDNVSGTTANKLILLKNRIQETGITIAGALLPAIQSITETIGPPISAVAKFAGEHKSLTTAAIGVVGSLVALKVGVAAVTWVAAGLGGAVNLAKGCLLGFAAVTRVAALAQTAFNAVMAANPVGIVVAAVAALGAGLVYLYKTCEPVRAIFDAVFTFIGDKITWVADKFRTVASGIRTFAKYLGLGGDDEAEAETAGQPGAPQTQQAETAVQSSRPQLPQAEKSAAQPEFVQIQDAWGMPAAPQPVAEAAAKAEPPSTVAQAVPVAAPAQSGKPVASQQPVMANVRQPSPIAQEATRPAASPELRPEPKTSQPHQETRPEPKKPQAPAKEPHTTAKAPDTSGEQTAPIPDMDSLFKQIASMRAEKNAKESTPPATQAAAQPQIIQPQVQVAVNVTQNGIPDAQFATGVMNAIRARQAELERMISAIVNEQARLAYG